MTKLILSVEQFENTYVEEDLDAGLSFQQLQFRRKWANAKLRWNLKICRRTDWSCENRNCYNGLNVTRNYACYKTVV